MRRDSTHSSFRIPHSSFRIRGAILPTVLLMLLLLGLLVSGFAFQVHADRAGTQASVNAFQTRLAAEAGIQRAVLLLRTDRLNTHAWFDNPEQFKNIVVWARGGDETLHGLTKKPDELPEPTAYRFSLVADNEADDITEIRYGLTAENAKLNLNTASDDELLRLFQQVIVVDESDENPPDLNQLVRSLAYWRGTGTDNEEGEEERYYADLDTPYRPKRTLLETVEELLMVRGFDGRILYGEDYDRNGLMTVNEDDNDAGFPDDNGDGILNRGLHPFVTVWSRDLNTATDNRPRVNLKSDPELVRARLEEFITEPEVVEHILNSVKEKETEGQKDDKPGKEPSSGDTKTDRRDDGSGDSGESGTSTGGDGGSGSKGGDRGNPRRPERPGRGEGRKEGGRESDTGSEARPGRPPNRDSDSREREAKPDRPEEKQSRGARVLMSGRGGSATSAEVAIGGVPASSDANLSGSPDNHLLFDFALSRDAVKLAALKQTAQAPGRTPRSTRDDEEDADGGSNPETAPEQADRDKEEDPEEEQSDQPEDEEREGATTQPVEPPLPTPASLLRGEDGREGGSPVTMEHLPILLDHFTYRDPNEREIFGLIDINTAPVEVLRILGDLTEEQIEAIVGARTELEDVTLQSPAWLLTEGVLDLDTFEKIAGKICTRSDRFTIESLGYGDHIGTMTRLQVLVEMRGPVPQIMRYQDLTHLGTNYPVWYEEGDTTFVQRGG